MKKKKLSTAIGLGQACMISAYLAVLRGCILPLSVNANIPKLHKRPPHRRPVQFRESPSLHLVPDHGDKFRPSACILVESRDGKEQVLERIEGEVFCRCAREGVGAGLLLLEEVGREGEAEV